MRKRLGLTAVVAAVSFFSGGWLMQGATARPAPDGPRLLGEVLDHVCAAEHTVDSRIVEGDEESTGSSQFAQRPHERFG